MTEFALYSTLTGEILKTGSCPRRQLAAQIESDDEAIILQAADDSRHRVRPETGEVVPLEPVCGPIEGATIQADGEDAFRVGGILSGTHCKISGPLEAEGIIEDGELVFTTDKPGRYTITLSAYCRISREVEVHAV